MSEHDLKRLLEAIPKIAKVVNEFKSEDVQKLAFQHFIGALGIDGTSPEYQVNVTNTNTRETKTSVRKKRTNTEASSDGKATKGKKTRQKGKSTPSFVKELNLRPPNKKSLEEFVEEKKPNSNQKLFPVLVAYLRNEAGIQSITPDHIYTCFKSLKKRLPINLPQGLRSAANRDGFIDTSDTQNIKLTTHGENFIEHDLPPKSKNGK